VIEASSFSRKQAWHVQSGGQDDQFPSAAFSAGGGTGA
jgi:hypothetical protein